MNVLIQGRDQLYFREFMVYYGLPISMRVYIYFDNNECCDVLLNNFILSSVTETS